MNLDKETIESTRNMLLFNGFESYLVKHKTSGRYGVVLDNNVCDAKEISHKLVVWRGLYGNYNLFCMDRDEFYERFEEAFDDDNAVKSLIEYFNKGVKG